MISQVLVGLGLIAIPVGSLASEIWLAKKISTKTASLNHGHDKVIESD